MRIMTSFRLVLLAAYFLLLASPASLNADSTKKAAADSPVASSSPELVDIGVWPTLIYNLDVHSNTYFMTAYVWFVWRGELDPSETV